MRRLAFALMLAAVLLVPAGATRAWPQDNEVQKKNFHELLPRDVIAYLHVKDIQKTFSTAMEAGLKNLSKNDAKKFETQFNGLKAIMSMYASSADMDLDQALEEITDFHMVLIDISKSEDPSFVLAIESRTADFFSDRIKRLAKPRRGEIRPFSMEEYKGIMVYRVTDASGEVIMNVINIDTILMMSNSMEEIKRICDRSKSPAGKRLLEKNARLLRARELAPRGKHLVSYGFLDVQRLFRGLDRLWTRREKEEFDRVDAFMELRMIKSMVFATTLEGDLSVCDAEITFDKNAEAYDVVRQEAGTLESLNLVPEESWCYVAARVEKPEETWDRLLAFVVARMDPGEAGSADDELEEATGVTPAELFSQMGHEAGCFFLPTLVDGKNGGGGRGGIGTTGALYMEIKDPKEAEAILKSLTKNKAFRNLGGKTTRESYHGVDLVLGRDGKFDEYSAYAFLDKYLVLANNRKVLEKSVDAWKDGTSVAHSKKHARILKAMGDRHSKVMYVDIEKVVDMAVQVQKKKGMSMDEVMGVNIVSTLLKGFQFAMATVEEEDRLQLKSVASGPFSWVSSMTPGSLSVGLLALVGWSSQDHEADDEETPPPPREKNKGPGEENDSGQEE